MKLDLLKDLNCDKYHITIQNLMNFVNLNTKFIMETVIITTLFHPDEFGVFYDEIEEVVKEKVYIIKYGKKDFTYIRTEAGESIGNLLIAIAGICKRIIFISAVGSLHTDIHTGDIVIPAYSMQSMSFIDQVRKKKFYFEQAEKFYPDADMAIAIEDICKSVCSKYKNNFYQIPACSISSLFTELKFIDQIADMGFKIIEMETALLYAISDYFGIETCAVTQVSDNFDSTPLLGDLNMKEVKKCFYLRQTQWNEIISQILLLYSK